MAGPAAAAAASQETAGLDLDTLDALFRNDLEAYCANLVRIKTKEGPTKYLRLNYAQEYVGARLDEQLAKAGKVRALILKARQLGMCLSPDMRVLTADLRWVPIAEISTGDELVSVDEDVPGGRGCDRKMRTCRVEGVRNLTGDAFRLTLDSGVKLVVTGEHRFLFQQRGGTYTQWRTAGKAKIGDKIRYITEPWEPGGIEDAWFGGLLDGEGSLRPKDRAGAELCVAQVDGPVLERARSYLESRGYTFREEVDRREAGTSSKLGKKEVHKFVISRIEEIFRALGQTNPARFIGRRWWEGKSLPGKRIGTGWARVVDIEPLGQRPMVDIQTSTKTFIVEGIVSHNSTYVGARFYRKTTLWPGQRTYILTHEDKSTQALFDMAKRIHDNMDVDFRPAATTQNANDLDFGGIDSGYRVGTAKNVAGLGRGMTVQNFHGSEVAFWPHADKHFAGVMQAVPEMDGTEIILESTANGVGGVFYDQWQLAERGESDYIAIFIPWFWDFDYRRPVPSGFHPSTEEVAYREAHGLDLEQICWAHFKNISLGGEPGEFCWLFRQEYPANAEEAFQTSGEDTLIRPEHVMRARKHTALPQEYAPRILGVDVARGGGDFTRLLDRCGRAAGKIVNKTLNTRDLMVVAGAVARAILDNDIHMAFVDVTGLGAGVYDRLVEVGLGARVTPVNFAQKAEEDDRYRNKRAEIWARTKDWLADPGGVDIPDDNTLHRHLCAPTYQYDSSGRLQLESKEKIRERLGFSPDGGDALALTFSETVVLPKQASWRDELYDDGLNTSGGTWMGRL